MVKPSHIDKVEKETSHVAKGKITIGGKSVDVDIQTNTKPNQAGGYDTVVKIPSAHPLGTLDEYALHFTCPLKRVV